MNYEELTGRNMRRRCRERGQCSPVIENSHNGGAIAQGKLGVFRDHEIGVWHETAAVQQNCDQVYNAGDAISILREM